MPLRTFLVATVLGVLLLSFVPAGTAAPAAEPRTVTYPGSGLQVHLGEVGKLDETSPGFRRFVHDRLLRLWKLAGGSQKCRPAPAVIVKTWMSDGFAASTGIDTACLRQRAAQPASQDHLFHTLLGLLDVGTALYEPEWDLAARCRPRRDIPLAAR